jgi:hypothetical protein
MRHHITFIILFAILASTANADCSGMGRLICAEYFNSAAVVEASLVSKRRVVPPDNGVADVYTMETTLTLRGHVASRFDIFEEHDSAGVSFAWEKGESYLLFLHPMPGGKMWFVDGCGNSAPLAESAKTLKIIESFSSKPNFGLIHGLIVASPYGMDVAEGTRIEVRGEGRVYTARPNRDGEFKIRLIPGKYEARAFHEGWKIDPDIFTHEFPSDLHLERGGCAQIQFLAKKDDTGKGK